MTWKYDLPELRDLLHDGKVELDEADMIQSFLYWLDNDYILTFNNNDTGEEKEVIASKRGNATYAKNKRRRAWEINNGMKNLKFDFPVYNARGVVRESHLLLITLTFDTKKISKEEAWEKLTAKGKELNRFSANLEKIFGSKATWKVKEGTKSGYPAPHILIIIDRPVRVFRYRGKWRLQSNFTLERLRRVWRFGFIDVEAIVNNKFRKRGVVGYLTKYMTKTVSIENIDGKRTDSERTAILTHVWNKLYRSRDILSKAFKDRLNHQFVSRNKRSEPSPWVIIEKRYGLSVEGMKRKDNSCILISEYPCRLVSVNKGNSYSLL